MRTSPVERLDPDKVVLMPLRDDDVDALYEIAKNPASIEDYQYAAKSPASVEEWVDASFESEEYAWTVRPCNDEKTVVGMVAFEPVSEQVAEAGFFIDEAFTGRGYATSALTAAVAWVFENTDIQRITASVTEGRNVSRRVAEKAGFTFEGVARRNWNWKGSWLNSLNYSMLRDDPALQTFGEAPGGGSEAAGTVIKVTKANLKAVMKCNVSTEQRGFVAPNVVSIAQAHFEPGAWFRAIAGDDDSVVGFVMLFDPSIEGASQNPDSPRDGAYLWRLMVGEGQQKKGFGRTGVAAAAEYSRSRGFSKLYVSAHDEAGGPVPFYEKLGFRKTGRVIDGEVELVVGL